MLYPENELPNDRKIIKTEHSDYGRYETFVYKGHIYVIYISHRKNYIGGGYSMGWSNIMSKVNVVPFGGDYWAD